MGWLIFAAYLFCGIMYHLFNQIEKSAPEGSLEKKIAKTVMYSVMGIVGLGVMILALYAIGWIWYFFCGGFLIFFVFFFGFVLVCLGWDPDNRR